MFVKIFKIFFVGSMFTATVSKNEHRWLALLFDISDLLQIMFIALELHIDHGTGVYKLNEFRFATHL